MPTTPARARRTRPSAARHALHVARVVALAAALPSSSLAGGCAAGRVLPQAAAPVASATPSTIADRERRRRRRTPRSPLGERRRKRPRRGSQRRRGRRRDRLGGRHDARAPSTARLRSSGRALFEKVREQLPAPDLMVGNLEGTFGDGGKSKSDGDSSNSYSFQAPPKNAEALAWAGFDVMSLANNHAYDYFEKGLSSTRKALERQRHRQTPACPARSRCARPTASRWRSWRSRRTAGTRPSPTSRRRSKLVRKAKDQADVVVVLMHAGAEGADKTHTPKGAEKAYGEFRGDPRAFSHAMIDAGASMVLGLGPARGARNRALQRQAHRLLAGQLRRLGQLQPEPATWRSPACSR